MKQKYCPYCDQKMKISHYCQECRRIVWQPYEQNVDYYLNERHPQSEKNCLYHDNTKQPEKMGKTKPNVPKPLSVFMIVIGLCVACNILGSIFMVGRSAFYGISDMLSELNRPDESVSSYQELTDEEVKKIGAACNTQGHYDVDLEEAASVLQDAFHTMGYSWNMYPYSYNETDGEYSWYQTEYDYHVDTDDENANGTTVEICADTATGQLHGIYIWSEDEKHFLDMADIAVETMKTLGLLPGAPEGRTLYAESLEYNPYESSEPRYGAEIVGEQGGGGDYYQLRIMAPEQ